MRTIPVESLCRLQQDASSVRNVCILAHVDHGKTTLADSLVAANGIISPRLVGQMRYMDSRPDEQERGITMKSSAIALYYKSCDRPYLVNLIDSPGHIEFFSGEVCTATRLCDGALVVVDLVEGVCPQTHSVLRQAWREALRPVLVLNKLDRLITELKMTTDEAHKRMNVVLEQVNAIAGELFVSKVIEQHEKQHEGLAETSGITVASELDDLEQQESAVYFRPEVENVVFASALDGWGFQIRDFAEIFSKKTGVKQSVLERTLWGDYYLDSKAKRIRKGAFDQGRKPIFVQLILENIWSVYDTVLNQKDEERREKIVSSLGVKLTRRDAKHQDPKVSMLFS